MLDFFTQLTIVIVFAAVLGVLFRLVRQPTILAYLAAGMAASALGYFALSETGETFTVFSELGIVFLLFLVGLEMNYETIRVIGRDAAIIGVGQVLFTFLIGFLLAYLFDFSALSSFYIAFALTLSSTIIVVNMLSEKKELNSVHGRISLGVLLIQDFIVVIVLVILAGVGGASPFSALTGAFSLGEGALSFIMASLTFVVGVLLFGVSFYLGRRVIPRIFEYIATSPELIFITSLAWLFGLTTLVDLFGFSKEIGGFLAGITLANSYERFEISYRIKSLRDFFILVFFVILGATLVSISGISGIIIPVIVFSLFVLIGNPLIVMAIMGVLGYRRRASFLTGTTIAQISEFSLVLAALGVTLGHIGGDVFGVITFVGVVTILSSTYLIAHGTRLYKILSPYLARLERTGARQGESLAGQKAKPIVLVGFSRTGRSVAHHLPKEDVLIVDYDPHVVRELRRCGYDHMFGDATDADMRSQISFENIRVFISTAPEIGSNMVLLQELFAQRTKTNGKFRIILRARTDKEAELLYENGADYVLLPHTTAGRFLAKHLAQDPYLSTISNLRERDRALLKDLKVC